MYAMCMDCVCYIGDVLLYVGLWGMYEVCVLYVWDMLDMYRMCMGYV